MNWLLILFGSKKLDNLCKDLVTKQETLAKTVVSKAILTHVTDIAVDEPSRIIWDVYKNYAYDSDNSTDENKYISYVRSIP